MERKHIQKAYVMLMTMKMFKMSTSFSRFQTEDVNKKQDVHRKDTQDSGDLFHLHPRNGCKWCFDPGNLIDLLKEKPRVSDNDVFKLKG
jgi:hypothetical protein